MKPYEEIALSEEDCSFNLKIAGVLTMKTEQKQLGQSHGMDTRGLSPIAKAVVQPTAIPFDDSSYGEHAGLLGVGATFSHPSMKGVNHAQ